MSDLISRQSLKQKLQKHHDFFVDAYGGFSNLPQNDKSRVDEITNCIAIVVNEPSVTIPSVENECGTWRHYEGMLYCPKCGAEFYDEIMEYTGDEVPKHCPDCGADMRGEE